MEHTTEVATRAWGLAIDWQLQRCDVCSLDQLGAFPFVQDALWYVSVCRCFFASSHEVAGPISSITTMGNTVIVLNDAETAENILEKRSGATAGRPRHVVASEM